MITARRKEIQELVNRLALLKVSRSGDRILILSAGHKEIELVVNRVICVVVSD